MYLFRIVFLNLKYLIDITPYLIQSLNNVDFKKIVELEFSNEFSLWKGNTNQHEWIKINNNMSIIHIPLYESFLGSFLLFLGKFESCEFIFEIHSLVLDYLQDKTLLNSFEWVSSFQKVSPLLAKLWWKNPKSLTRIFILFVNALNVTQVKSFIDSIMNSCPESMSMDEFIDYSHYLSLFLDSISCHFLSDKEDLLAKEYFDDKLHDSSSEFIHPMFIALASKAKSVNPKFKQFDIWFKVLDLSLKNPKSLEFVLAFLISTFPTHVYIPMGSLYSLITICLENGSKHVKLKYLFIDLILKMTTVYSMNEIIFEMILDHAHELDIEFVRDVCRVLPGKELWIRQLWERFSIYFSRDLNMIKSNHLYLFYLFRFVIYLYNSRESQEFLIYQNIPIIWDLFEYAIEKSDKSNLQTLIKHLQCHISLFKEWWNFPTRRNVLGKDFGYYYDATCSIIRIYSKLGQVSEPFNSIQVLLPSLKGLQIAIILNHYCFLIEAKMGVSEIGSIEEWQNRFGLILQDIIRKLVLDKSLNPQVADYFLIGLSN